MKNPLTVIGGVITLIGLLLVAVWVFASTGGLTNEQRNYAFITIVGLVVNAIPSLLALLKSEATQHDLRNGVVVSKVADALGTEPAQEALSASVKTALEEHQVVTRTGPVASLSMQALAKLLEATDTVHEQASSLMDTATETTGEDKANG